MDTKTRSITSIKRMRTLYKVFAVVLMIALLITASAVTAFAADPDPTNNSATNALTNLNNFLVGIMKLIGFAVALYGVVQLALSIQQHDGSQRVQGILFFVTGIIIFFAKEILEVIGITI